MKALYLHAFSELFRYSISFCHFFVQYIFIEKDVNGPCAAGNECKDGLICDSASNNVCSKYHIELYVFILAQNV